MILARLVEWTWNGDSSNGPGIFSWFHILWLLIAIAGAVGLVFLAKKKDKIKRLDDWVILSMAVVLIISEIPKHILYDIEYYGYLRIDILPFSFCSVPMFVALVGSLVKEGKIKNVCYTFLSFYGIIGGIAVLAYASTLDTPFVYISLQTMLWHAILLWMGVYLIAARKYGRDYKKEVIPASLLFLALSLCAIGANEAVYHGFLEPQQTPVVSLDRDPGSYQYYKYGTYDEEHDRYYYLKANDDGSVVTTDAVKEATTFVVTYPEGDNYDIFLITYENSADETRYIELEEDGDSIKVVSKAEATSTWAFTLVGEDHYVFGYLIGDKTYCLAYTKDGQVDVKEADTFPADYLQPDFINVKVAREGDAANFFFISKHCKTSIPVLDIVQENAPYVVFVLVYLISFFGVANGAWGIAKLVRVILDKNKKEAEK